MIQTRIIDSRPRLAISVAGSGPLVILVHGMGGDRTTWTSQLEALAPCFTAVSVDLRGYGDSEDIPDSLADPLNFKRDFSADLAHVMDHFSVPRAHLVGLSMGGRVARAASLLMPHRVASLVLANTSPGFDAMSAADRERFVADRASALRGGRLPDDYGLTQARAMMAPQAGADAIHAAAAAIQGVRLQNYLRVLEASTLQDAGDRLEDIGCPALVIEGELDRVYPQPITRQLHARIPGARLVTIEGAGHLSNLEKPAAFNRAMLDFLRSLPEEQPATHP